MNFSAFALVLKPILLTFIDKTFISLSETYKKKTDASSKLYPHEEAIKIQQSIKIGPREFK